MSTCRRQLSTLERSFDSGSAVSVVSLIAASVRPPIDEPCLQKFAPSFLLGGTAHEGRELLLSTRHRLVESPRELAEPSLENRALRLRLRDERLDAPPQLRLRVGQPLLEAGDEFVPLPLEA